MPLRQAGVPGGASPWLVAVTVGLAAFMEVLDISIANVSLEHIAGSLSASQEEFDLGADLVSGDQRDRPADERLARLDDRPQTLFHRLHHRLQPDLAALRVGPEPCRADHRPRPAGDHRRRVAAELPGDHYRQLCPGKARPGLCRLRRGRRFRAGDRADLGRLDHRQFHLALGVPGERAGRHHAVDARRPRPRRPARSGRAAPGAPRRQTRSRLPGLRAAPDRDGGVADRARPGAGR